MLTLSEQSRVLAGILLLSIVTIELGGASVLRIVRGSEPATDLQRRFNRAGHAHAGVFVTLALVCQLLADAARLDGIVDGVARLGSAWAAILVPAGFFLSVLGKGTTEPNRLIVLLWLGAASLAAGSVALGVGLLTA